MPQVKGSLQGLLSDLWWIRYNMNQNLTVQTIEEHAYTQGMKKLIGHCEGYCLEAGIYEDMDELEEREYKSIRLKQQEQKQEVGK